MEFPQSDLNRVRRLPARGHYDKATVYEILDSAFLCHVGFSIDGQPFVIPTLFGRDGDAIYLHGSAASRMLTNLADGIPMCLTVTHVDGLVLARSAFHHSMNYRSAVLFGTAVEMSGEEKKRGLFIISENVLKGRWREVRAPNEQELKATTVLRMTIESASAKIRTGPPKDDEEDYALPIWAGVVPLRQTFGAPEADARLPDSIALPHSVLNLAASNDAMEASVLEFLGALLRAEHVRQALDPIAARVERMLKDDPQRAMAWEPVPLDLYGVELPASIRSSWVFVLRANTASGAERHPNSRQRMMSYRGIGDLQTRTSLDHEWSSHPLTSVRRAPLTNRWISVPPNVWHQAVVSETHWVVVSFHTASEHELIEERPAADEKGTQQRRYTDVAPG